MQIFVRDRAAFGEGGGDHGIEFRFQPAGADADDQATAGQHIDGGELLGGQHGLAMRDDDDGQYQADFRGLRGDPGGGGELFVADIVIGAVEFAGFRIGITRDFHVRQHHVIGDGEVIVTECFAGLGDAGHDAGIAELAAVGEVKAELHSFNSVR